MVSFAHNANTDLARRHPTLTAEPQYSDSQHGDPGEHPFEPISCQG